MIVYMPVDNGIKPPQYELHTLLGGNSKQEASLIKDIPEYSKRLELEISTIKKHPYFRGNPFLYGPQEYFEHFNGALPLWLRSFAGKGVNLRDEYIRSRRLEDKKVQMVEFQYRPQLNSYTRKVEIEMLKHGDCQIHVERHYFDDHSRLLVSVKDFKQLQSYLLPFTSSLPNETHSVVDYGTEASLNSYVTEELSIYPLRSDVSKSFDMVVTPIWIDSLPRHGYPITMDELSQMRAPKQDEAQTTMPFFYRENN